MLHKVIRSIESFGHRNAFCIDGNYYTYNDFADSVGRIISTLRESNCEQEKLIGVMAYNDIETYASIYAILFSGCGFVPLNPANPPDRNLSIADTSDIQTILTSRDFPGHRQLFPEKIKVMDTINLPDSAAPLTIPDTDKDDIAYILFTSGSTGKPKGVPVSRGNLAAFIEAFLGLGYDVSENDRFLQMFELTFDFSIFTYMLPLCIGACVYTIPSDGIKYASVYTIMEEYEITFAAMVPSILTYLRPYFPEILFPSMKYSLFCGEGLYSDIVREWIKCVPACKIINAYGPTEATVFCLIYDWDKDNSNKDLNGIISIGKAFNKMSAMVVDESLNPLPAGCSGELCLSGDQLISGYWKDPQKDKEAFFRPGNNGSDALYYRTGDLALVDAEGDFMYCGRLDFQVKIQGYRIELGEIEFHTRELTRLSNVAAVAHSNKNGIMQIHLFLEGYENGGFNSITEYLRTKVPEYMLPSTIRSMERFPLSINGKTDRKALAAMIEN